MSEHAAEYDSVIEKLRDAYNGSASKRDAMPKAPWKQAERQVFLDRLKVEGKSRLLEVGAGTGNDSVFFQQHGLSVVATDLSAEMVERCRAKGLEAHAMDFLRLDFAPGSFDAVYSLNCLLHVPNADLPEVLTAIRDLLVPGGLFFLGVYGGAPFEGIAPDDSHDPPRFFSFRTDEQIQALADEAFETVDFHIVGSEGFGNVARMVGADHFQALTLRAR